MSRFHNRNGVRIPFTAAEETARDAEEAAAAIPKIPQSATRYQIEIALIDLGHKDELETYVGGLSNSDADRKRRSYWVSREVMNITDQELLDAATALTYNQTQIDTLFTNASQI